MNKRWLAAPRLAIPAILLAAATVFAQTTSTPSLLSQADSVLAEMSRITGLPIKASLKKQIIEKSQIPGLIQENLREESSPQELAAEQASLKAFGLVPEDFDLEKFLVSFYTEQAAGFYDPRRKTMFIAGWITPDLQKIVLTHELTHALQDQNFDLERFLHAVEKNDDASNARLAVVEGYATAAMIQSMMEPVPLASMPSLQPFMAMAIHQNPAQYPVFAHAPFFLQFETLFPYSQGLEFMQQGLKVGGWPELNKLFQDPPDNTQQVFNPNKYFNRKHQTAISLSRPPALASAPGVKLLTENTMGELGYYGLLGQLLSKAEAKKVSPQWAADRYLVFSTAQPDRFILVSRTAWRSPAVADEFFLDYRSILGQRYPHLSQDARSRPNLFVGEAAHGWVVLVDHGSECRWAEGISAGEVDAMIQWLVSL
jgi:hypothetical protein